jgi:hypothetical protein
MTSIYAETSSALDIVLASLSLASGEGKLRRREGSHWRSFHLVLRTLLQRQGALWLSVVDGLIFCELPLSRLT